MRKKWSHKIKFVLMALSLAALMSCGSSSGSSSGGGGGGGSQPPGDGGTPPGGGGNPPAAAQAKPGVSTGVMKKGSVILNGVTLTIPAGTPIIIDDKPNMTEADLKDGMVVKVRGKFNPDKLTGTIEKIQAEDEVQGNVEAVDAVAGTITVLGQTVKVDANTVFPAGQSFAAIAAPDPIAGIPGDMVEVHGLRNNGAGPNGDIQATRIEVGKITAAAGGLQRLVGPNDPVNGFPTFYQDENGLALGLCLDPVNCLVDPVDPLFPFSVTTGFGAEAFWWSADALIPIPSGNALLVLALEAAYGGTGDPVDGQQISFSRVRIRIDAPVAGATYTVTHPYGVETFVADATVGQVRSINFSNDAGIGAPGVFTGALTGQTFPFLTQVAPPPPAGFVGDLLEGTVTGSPNGTNFFRIDGPNIGGPGVNRVETDLFAVSGQIFSNVVEVKGAVEGLDVVANTMTMGLLHVNLAGATIAPAGATITAGARVEIEGVVDAVTGALNAQKVEIEAVEDAEFEAAEAEEAHVEGYISGFTAHPGTFNVGAVSVSTTATTVFAGGVATDLANGKAVRVEGTMTGGSLVAAEIEFKTAL